MNKKEQLTGLIVAIYGGMGNQMFQYAAGRALSLKYGIELYLDLNFFKNTQKVTRRNYALDAFSLNYKTAAGGVHPVYKKESLLEEMIRRCQGRKRPRASSCIAETELIASNEALIDLSKATPEDGTIYIDGHWAHEKYFKNYEEHIRRDFAFPGLKKEMLEAANKIANTPNSVSVHVRRGDYIKISGGEKNWAKIIPYYKHAARVVTGKVEEPYFYVFTDDKAWVKSNLQRLLEHENAACISIDAAEEYCDMQLMSLCRHHISANSTYSWWGAWLGAKGGLNYCPVDPVFQNIYPSDWIRIGY